jgi:hypothetical protein
MFSWMNALTTDVPGLFGILILVSVFTITFILNANKELEVSFAIASWITCISSIFLSMLTGSFGYLIPGNYVSATVFLAAISVILLYMRQR